MANFNLVTNILSDGSRTFDVTGIVGTEPGNEMRLTIGARSAENAYEILNALNEASWAEIEPLTDQEQLARDKAYEEWLDRLNEQQNQQAQQAADDLNF